jgi:hypothetical protein
MTKGYTAWRYFLKLYPTATSQTACVLCDVLSTISSMTGIFWVYAAEDGSTIEEDRREQHLEDTAHPRYSSNGLLIEFFGIDRKKGSKDEFFDPIELSDSLGYDPRVIKLFKKRDAEQGFKRP